MSVCGRDRDLRWRFHGRVRLQYPSSSSPKPASTVRLADTANRARGGVPVATASGRVVQLMLSSCHYALNSRPRRRGPGAFRRRASPPELWVMGGVQFVELNFQFLIILTSTAVATVARLLPCWCAELSFSDHDASSRFPILPRHQFVVSYPQREMTGLC